MIIKWIYKSMLILIVLIISVILAACIVLNHPRFGKLPDGKELEIIKNSPNYHDNGFRNLEPTPLLIDGANAISIIWDNHFNQKNIQTTPTVALPTITTNFTKLNRQQDLIIWLGHSSYFIQMGGKRLLVDPVFSDYASPFSFINKVFIGTNPYKIEDLPEIDYLILSHDHWDHLDYPTITQLNDKVKEVITPLGVGANLRYWGYPASKIREADWHTKLTLDKNLIVHILPARHYSGRLFSKNKTLWAGFALATKEHKIFFSGDSGYGTHFKEIAARLQGFDLVMLDSGQYDKCWPYIHMTPEEAVQAAQDLKAKVFMPAHVGKFSIANHSWDDPFIRALAASQEKPFKLITPLIGQVVFLDNLNQQEFTNWWETLK